MVQAGTLLRKVRAVGAVVRQRAKPRLKLTSRPSIKEQIRGRALEVKMKKNKLLLCALLIVVALQGCATLRGIGEDIQSLGRGLKRTVSE